MKKVEIEQLVWAKDCAAMLGCSVNLVSAVKKHLGIERKKVFPSEICKFLKQHPEFKLTDVWPGK